MRRPHDSSCCTALLTLAALSTACGDDGPATETLGLTTTTLGFTEPAPGTTTTPTSGPDSETSPPTSSAPTTTTVDPSGTTVDPSGTTVDPSGTTVDPSGTTTTDSSTGTTAPATASDASTSLASTSTGDEPCPQGEIVCDGNTAQVCNGMGGFDSETQCPDVCVPGLGCTLCVPNEGTCNGDVAHQCNEEGDGFDDQKCDPLQGVMCQDGSCVGACSPDNLGTSYIGCDYYAMVTPNVVGDNFAFAVVVSNVSNSDAQVTVTRGNTMVASKAVPAKKVEVIPLPWVSELKTTGASRVVADGAYRIRSTQPITAYQYSPLDYQAQGQFSYTNDASLLMPTNAYGKETIAVARNTLNGLPGLISVVAREDNTTVTLMPSATGKIIAAGGGVAANGTGVVVIGEGDVLQVLSAAGGGGPDVSDVTGTRVLSDKPVMVMGAHACTYIPYNVTACDHLEELNLPLDNLAKEYLVTDPFIKAGNSPPQLKDRMVRITATEAATTLTYDPPQPGAPSNLTNAGDYAEFLTQKDFKITANNKIAVSEYMLGQDYGGGTGDPAMTIAVPIDQYRQEIAFHAPVNYESNFANLTAPMGSSITLDGGPVGALTAIGASGYGVVRVQLANNGDGNHTIVGDQSFGVQVYGYGQYTSYWYPGGLNLTVIPQ